MQTYNEQVLRFRVLKQLCDEERNPLGYWTLVYSTDTLADAEEMKAEQEERWGDLGDKFKVVDAGATEYMERTLSF